MVVDRACQNGHQRSCASVGIMLALGKGVRKDATRALEISERACAAGVDYACTTAGSVILADQPGGPPDLARVRDLYEKGCTDHHPAGCHAFAMLCASGKLGPALRARAEPLLHRACDHGHSPSCESLARWERLR
jgi:TPR repeat protein